MPKCSKCPKCATCPRCDGEWQSTPPTFKQNNILNIWGISALDLQNVRHVRMCKVCNISKCQTASFGGPARGRLTYLTCLTCLTCFTFWAFRRLRQFGTGPARCSKSKHAKHEHISGDSLRRSGKRSTATVNTLKISVILNISTFRHWTCSILKHVQHVQPGKHVKHVNRLPSEARQEVDWCFHHFQHYTHF